MNRPPLCKVMNMSVQVEDLFTEKHKATIREAVGQVKNLDQLHTVVITPLFLLKNKENKQKAFSSFDCYEVTVISDYNLIKNLVKRGLPYGVEPSEEESNEIIAESLVENIFEQYSEVISFQ